MQSGSAVTGHAEVGRSFRPPREEFPNDPRQRSGRAAAVCGENRALTEESRPSLRGTGGASEGRKDRRLCSLEGRPLGWVSETPEPPRDPRGLGPGPRRCSFEVGLAWAALVAGAAGGAGAAGRWEAKSPRARPPGTGPARQRPRGGARGLAGAESHSPSPQPGLFMGSGVSADALPQDTAWPSLPPCVRPGGSLHFAAPKYLR